jgi:hypothetical protein
MDRKTITHADIPWTPASTPRLERIPASGAYLSDLPHPELLAYTLDLREDLAAVRFTLHQALASVSRLMTTNGELRDEIEYLRAERRRRAA